MWRLEKGTFRRIEEIGYGVTSTVYLVQRQQPYLVTASKVANNLEKVKEGVKNNVQKMKEIQSEQNSLEEKIQNEHNNQQLHSPLHSKPSKQNKQREERSDNSTPKQEIYALKEIIVGKSGIKNRALVKQFNRQLIFLRQLSHPGITKLIDNGKSQSSKGTSLNMVIEWGRGGTLRRLIDLIHQRSHLQRQKQTLLRYYSGQVVEIIGYLQARGISHRDIKAQNFVLDEQYRLTLIDFGSAEIFNHQKAAPIDVRLQTMEDDRMLIGSPHYISPEMIRRSQKGCENSSNYSKTDIWSLGILIFYMFNRHFPFMGIKNQIIQENIKEQQVTYQQFQDKHLIQLLKHIFKKNPSERANIEQIKSSRYFRDTDFNSLYQNQSPLLEINRNQHEQYFFKGQANVKIQGCSKRRIVALLSRKVETKQILQKQVSTVQMLDIKKNCSSLTEVNSQKIIESQQKIQRVNQNKERRMFLSISRSDANCIPKQLQFTPAFKTQCNNFNCLLSGLKVCSRDVQQPITVQVKFRSDQELLTFLDGLKAMIK